MEDDEILITDIEPRCWQPGIWNLHVNRGYGSLLMENLLQYAKEHNIKCIYGYLSMNDVAHKNRLHYFYEKFGFTITEYKEIKDNLYGEIELTM